MKDFCPQRISGPYRLLYVLADANVPNISSNRSLHPFYRGLRAEEAHQEARQDCAEHELHSSSAIRNLKPTRVSVSALSLRQR